jgi:transcriptional regulator with XRE-family HTH domain
MTGQELRARRRALGVSQDKLAQFLGLARRETISGWECGRFPILHGGVLSLALDQLAQRRGATTTNGTVVVTAVQRAIACQQALEAS